MDQYDSGNCHIIPLRITVAEDHGNPFLHMESEV